MKITLKHPPPPPPTWNKASFRKGGWKNLLPTEQCSDCRDAHSSMPIISFTLRQLIFNEWGCTSHKMRYAGSMSFTTGMAQWSSYQLQALMGVNSSLAPTPSLLTWVKRESNRTMRGLNWQSLENSLHQVCHKTHLFTHKTWNTIT